MKYLCTSILLSLFLFSSALADTEGSFTYDVQNGGAVVTAWSGQETRLEIPETLGGLPVREIGARAFADSPLLSVTIPASVRILRREAFSGAALYEVRFHAGLETIGARTFAGCAGLFGAALPGTLQSIGDGAFSDCEELGYVTLPESVEQIEGNPFAGCPRLTALPMPADHPHFFMKDGALTSSADGHIICTLPVQSEGGTP